MRTKWTVALVLAAAIVIAAGLVVHGTKANAAVGDVGGTPRVFLQVTGSKAGAVNGQVASSPVMAPGVANEIAVYEVSYGMTNPGPPAGGGSAGALRSDPLNVTIDWSKASPLLYNLCATHEKLSSVVLGFYEPYSKTKAGVKYREYAKCTLKDSFITSIKEVLPTQDMPLSADPLDGANTDYKHMEIVSFTPVKLEWASVTYNTTSAIDFGTP